MADHYETSGQAFTEAWKNSNGSIVIVQWNESDRDYHSIRFDRWFVPALIEWLQGLIAPEAVG